MNIFITGCAGFIGSSLVDKLLESTEDTIIGIDNFDPYYSREIKEKNIKSFINNKRVIFYEDDIRNNEIISEIFEKHNIDVVVHIAAKAGVRKSFENPSDYISVNVDGTANILNAMQKYGVKKLVFSSSSSVYGNCNAKMFKEDITDLEPISPYAQTKKTCEDLIKHYSSQFGINAVCLRLFTVFGPKQRPDLAVRKFSECIMNDRQVPLYGDGTTYRDYTYIDDITDGIIASMKYDKTPFEIINLGSQNPVTLDELVQYIEEELGKKAMINHCPMQQGDVVKTYADITKAKELLGYYPKFTFKQGLHRFIEQLSISE